MARPMPRLDPVTMATFPARPRSMGEGSTSSASAAAGPDRARARARLRPTLGGVGAEEEVVDAGGAVAGEGVAAGVLAVVDGVALAAAGVGDNGGGGGGAGAGPRG